MAITANSGPEIIFGITVGASGNTTSYNDQRGPSLIDLGDGMLDPRAQFQYGYNPGTPPSTPIFGFFGQQGIVDFVPSTISTNALAAKSTGNGGGLPITLTATGAGITTVTSIIAPETGKLAGTLFAIDTPCGGSTAAGVSFGQSNTIQIWNPASVAGRCITIVATAAGDSGNWTIAGRDAYGFKVTEQIVATTATMTSLKAYKYISAVSAPATLASTSIQIGTADTYGFPMLVQHPAYATIWIGGSSNATLITLGAGNHTFGSSLLTATATNGDVRGTYASTLASNSTGSVPTRIVMFVSPTVGPGATSPTGTGLNNIGATSSQWYTLFGAAQFSSV